MPRIPQTWCAHPRHDEILPNGKKRFWKTGSKPSHPKGKRLIKHDLAELINCHHQAIINGSSSQLSEGDYLCTWCFATEEKLFMSNDEKMETDNYQSSPEEEKFDDDIDDDVDYDVDHEDNDDENVLDEQTVARKKLNEVFQLLDVKKIDDTLVISLTMFSMNV